MRLTTFNQDVGVLAMAHRDGIGVGVVQFLIGPGTWMRRRGYLESTGELVWVCVLDVVRDGGAWCGCRV